MIRVKHSDGTTYTFPDGTSQEAMQAAINEYSTTKAGLPAHADISRVGAAPGQRIGMADYLRPLAPYAGGIAGGALAGSLAGPAGSAVGGLRGALLAGAAEMAGAGAGGGLAGALAGYDPVRSAIEQSLMAAPVAALRGIGVGAGTVSKFLQRRAQSKAVEGVERIAQKADVKDVVQRELSSATARRKAGGDASREVLAKSKERFNVGEIADKVIGKTGEAATPERRMALVRELREVIRDVRKAQTHGLIDERRVTWRALDADKVLRGLQRAGKPTFAAKQRGDVVRNPDLAADAATALRAIMHERIPDLTKTKAATEAAIKDVQGLSKGGRTPAEERVALERSKRRAAERAGRVGAPINAHIGFGPRALGTGASVDPMSSADALARLLGGPALETPGVLGNLSPYLMEAARYGPRGFGVADSLLRLLSEQGGER